MFETVLAHGCHVGVHGNHMAQKFAAAMGPITGIQGGKMSDPEEGYVCRDCGNEPLYGPCRFVNKPDLLKKYCFAFVEERRTLKDKGYTSLPWEFKSVKEPPLGLRPRWKVEALRIREILGAMNRYAQERKRIPSDWIDELSELTERQRGKG